MTIVGVAFLAIWAMVSNVTASFFLSIWRPFRRDDQVELLPEGFKGRVIDRNLMFTVLEEEPGTRLTVPNNMFFQRAFRVRELHEQYTMFDAEQPTPPVQAHAGSPR
jgi:small-conductance mechanosensitive channel